MQIELHRNNVYQGVQLLLLVPMFVLLAIPKCLLILRKIFITLVYRQQVIVIAPYNCALAYYCTVKGTINTGSLKDQIKITIHSCIPICINLFYILALTFEAPCIGSLEVCMDGGLQQ